MSKTGWVKIHRAILDDPTFQNEKLFKIWMYCLLKASHQEHEQMVGLQVVLLQPGEFVFGRIKDSARLDMKPSTLWKYLKALEKMGNIEIKSNNKFSVINVRNWSKYQDRETEREQQSNNKVTSKEQQRDTNKNDKNGKNEKKRDYIISGSENHELIKNLWSETGLPNIKKISAKRNQMLNARLKEHGEESFKEIVDQIKNSAFLRGQNKNGWSANFDWVIKPTNYLKVLEGTYRDDNRKARDEIIEGDFSHLDKYNLPD